MIMLKNNINIIIGQTYNCFHDGKIKESRKNVVSITDIIKFSDIDSEILNLWIDEVEECSWLYAYKTDYFIKGTMKLYREQYETVYFVRTIDNDWFSIGDYGGRLDIDNSLTLLLCSK